MGVQEIRFSLFIHDEVLKEQNVRTHAMSTPTRPIPRKFYRVKIVDPAFHGRSKGERHDYAWGFLHDVPEDILAQISVLLCVWSQVKVSHRCGFSGASTFLALKRLHEVDRLLARPPVPVTPRIAHPSAVQADTEQVRLLVVCSIRTSAARCGQ
jgi:hypothetical protein